jgi:hypothetical protein
MTFITVELDKFHKQANDVDTNLDKLIYTMQNLHTVTELSQFPTFWNEEWLKKAISEVDIRNMTPEQKLAYEMAISANVLAVKNENKKIMHAKEEEKIETIKSGLAMGLTVEQCASLARVSLVNRGSQFQSLPQADSHRPLKHRAASVWLPAEILLGRG